MVVRPKNKVESIRKLAMIKDVSYDSVLVAITINQAEERILNWES